VTVLPQPNARLSSLKHDESFSDRTYRVFVGQREFFVRSAEVPSATAYRVMSAGLIWAFSSERKIAVVTNGCPRL